MWTCFHIGRFPAKEYAPESRHGSAGLDSEGYAYATEYLELNTLKQLLKYLVREGQLPTTSIFPYPMKKPHGSSTHCWTREQVQAILEHSEREG